jgi:hypothetical protein
MTRQDIELMQEAHDRIRDYIAVQGHRGAQDGRRYPVEYLRGLCERLQLAIAASQNEEKMK